jgi:hypothetical protein
LTSIGDAARVGRGDGRPEVRTRLLACLLGLCTTALVSWAVCPQTPGEADLRFRGSFSAAILVQEESGIHLEQLTWLGSLVGNAWQTSLRASVVNDVFSYLAFSDVRRWGPLDLQTLTVFNPSTNTFQYFSSIIRFTAWGVSVENNAFLTASPTQSHNQIAATGSLEGIVWRGDVYMGLCPFEFRSGSFQTVSTWPSCGLELRTTIAFSSATGFDHFVLTATYPAVPFLSFGLLETDLTLTLEFNLQGKHVTPELRARTLGATACITPLLELGTTSDPLSVHGLTVYGLRMECSLENSVSVYAATSLADPKNYELTGYSEFYETFRFQMPLEGCCDRKGSAEVGLFFDRDSSSLMDWGMLKASIEMPVDRRVKFSVGVEHRPAESRNTLRLGGEVLF